MVTAADGAKVEGAAKRVADGVVLQVPMKRTGRLLSRRIDLSLNTAQAQTLRDLYDGLHEGGATLKSGKEILLPQHALVWLLENVGPIKK